MNGGTGVLVQHKRPNVGIQIPGGWEGGISHPAPFFGHGRGLKKRKKKNSTPDYHFPEWGCVGGRCVLEGRRFGLDGWVFCWRRADVR